MWNSLSLVGKLARVGVFLQISINFRLEFWELLKGRYVRSKEIEGTSETVNECHLNVEFTITRWKDAGERIRANLK